MPTTQSFVCREVPTGSMNGINTIFTISTDSGFVTLGAQNAIAGIANQNPKEQFFNGRISCVQYYNKALNLLEIKQNFNYFKGRFGV